MPRCFSMTVAERFPSRRSSARSSSAVMPTGVHCICVGFARQRELADCELGWLPQAPDDADSRFRLRNVHMDPPAVVPVHVFVAADLAHDDGLADFVELLAEGGCI